MRADAGGAPAPWDDFWYEPVGAGSSTGMRVTAATAKRIACVHACVSVIGRLMGAFPLGIYREKGDGGKSLARKHPLYQLLATRPNELQTSFQFRQMQQGHLELRGNAYAEIYYGRRDTIQQLVPMHPDRVVVELLRNGRKRFRYDDPLTNETRYLAQEEVFHLQNWSDDGIAGQSTIEMGVDTFGVALAAQEYSARFFENDAVPRAVFEGANFKTKQDEDGFVESWQRQHTRQNRHKIGMLPPGMTVKELGMKPSDAQLLDARKFGRIEICSMFGVPPHLIGETEKTATYASVEQFNIMFMTMCLWPRAVNWEQTIQRDFLQDDDSYFAKFSMAALNRGDTAARYAAYKVGIENGWLSQNDVRAMEDLNPIDGGNRYWRPLNWAPLTDLQAGPQQSVDETDDPSAADPDQADSPDPSAMQSRLAMLASSAAERCVRKEMAAVRKLRARDAGEDEYREFYAHHAEFITEILKIETGAASDFCGRRMSIACSSSMLFEDHFCATGVKELAHLAGNTVTVN